MRRVESIQDEMNGTVTYELGNGRFVTLDARAVREYGAAEILRHMGHEFSTERVKVMQRGHYVGTVPGDFDPLNIQSRTFLYDPRPGDFRRDGDIWIVADMLGPGDLEAIPRFEREGRDAG